VLANSWPVTVACDTLSGHVPSALLAPLLAVPTVIAARRWLDCGSLAGLGLPSSLKEVGKPLAIVPLLTVLVLLYEALPEELAFRGYVYRVMAE
jgi:membrane protease YdiL (CAAX protease family)